MWLLDTSFIKLVTVKWNSLFYFNNLYNGNSAKIFVSKLGKLRFFLKRWNKIVFGSVRVKKDKILCEMLDLDKLSESR